MKCGGCGSWSDSPQPHKRHCPKQWDPAPAAVQERARLAEKGPSGYAAQLDRVVREMREWLGINTGDGGTSDGDAVRDAHRPIIFFGKPPEWQNSPIPAPTEPHVPGGGWVVFSSQSVAATLPEDTTGISLTGLSPGNKFTVRARVAPGGPSTEPAKPTALTSHEPSVQKWRVAWRTLSEYNGYCREEFSTRTDAENHADERNLRLRQHGTTCWVEPA